MDRYTFVVDEAHGYLHTRYRGNIRVEDIREALVLGNLLYPGLDSLVDFSEASLTDLSADDVLTLVPLAAANEPRDIRSAFVAPRDLEFGLTRMYDMLADAELPQHRAVFRSLREAEDWLKASSGIAVTP